MIFKKQKPIKLTLAIVPIEKKNYKRKKSNFYLNFRQGKKKNIQKRVK